MTSLSTGEDVAVQRAPRETYPARVLMMERGEGRGQGARKRKNHGEQCLKLEQTISLWPDPVILRPGSDPTILCENQTTGTGTGYR